MAIRSGTIFGLHQTTVHAAPGSNDGFRVVLNYAGNAENAEAAVAEIKAADGHAFAVQGDVADAAAVERLFQETLGPSAGSTSW